MKFFFKRTLYLIFWACLMHAAVLEAAPNTRIPHPLGDKCYAYVYTFIGDYMVEVLKEDKKNPNEQTADQLFFQQQMALGDPSIKPHSANMQEGEMAGLLGIILLKNKAYEMVTLFKKSGIGLSTSGRRNGAFRPLHTRPEPLKLGVITPELLSGPRAYTYIEKEKTYKEFILTLYEDQGNYFTEIDQYAPSQDLKKYKIIGYISYIVDVSSPFIGNKN